MKPVAALFATAPVVRKLPILNYDEVKQLNHNWQLVAERTPTYRTDTEDNDA